MVNWKEIGQVHERELCPKCGGFLIMHRDDIEMYATCCKCLTCFVREKTLDAESYITHGLR